MTANRHYNLKMIVIPKSSNKKTGDIIQSYSSKDTCPTSCPFKDNGCYAESLHTRMQWERCDDIADPRRVSNHTELFAALVEAAAMRLRRGQKEVMFRHNVAGDIAFEGSQMINVARLKCITEACNRTSEALGIKLRGYTYTHCGLWMQNVKAVLEATKNGFTVNFSCETVGEVREANALGCDTVITSVEPKETIKALKAEGIRAVQCPAQTHDDISCESCMLCSRHRGTTVVFSVHGNGSKKAKKVIMLKAGKLS